MSDVKIYHGFGHTNNMIVYGHVFKKLPAARRRYSDNMISNIIQLLKLFFVKPLPERAVRLHAAGQTEDSETELDGFFKFEWASQQHLAAGWHPVQVSTHDKQNTQKGIGHGRVFVPHTTQYGFISDIDDTIMISHSGTIGRRLRELFIKNPRSRSMFEDVAHHYELLAASHTTAEAPNPFFYVSSSEWNLYDYLVEFFNHNKLPEGAFLLNQIKRWYQLWKTGKTKHEGKLLRIVRILTAFPKQQFILLGDNSQSDPMIYGKLVEKYREQIFAVYIRNVNADRVSATEQFLSEITSHNIHTCFFKHSSEAIEHSRQIGLIENESRQIKADGGLRPVV
jgi:phosphatidate phosphatase APP1